MKVLNTGGIDVHVPFGSILVGEIFPDRRVATKQRRARGGGSAIGLLVSGRKAGRWYGVLGRRAGDAAAHEERRAKFRAFVPCSDNPLGQPRYRRKTDERRVKSTIYIMDPDPRVRALERRGKTLTFLRYKGIDGAAK